MEWLEASLERWTGQDRTARAGVAECASVHGVLVYCGLFTLGAHVLLSPQIL